MAMSRSGTITSPLARGDQIIAIFTLSRASEPAFADQDLRLIGSLEWVD